MASVDFAWDVQERTERPGVAYWQNTQISDEVLSRNVSLFIRIRWAAAAGLLFYSAVSLLPVQPDLGILFQGHWSVVLALFLFASNTAFYIVATHASLRDRVPPRVQIWTQMLTDLAGITIVVHFCGSIHTPAPFLYILHIALASVFFSLHISLLVVVISALLYGICVFLEYSGAVSPATIFINEHTNGFSLWLGWQVIPAIVLFALLWFLLSRLAKVIRDREDQITRADAEILRIQAEKDQYAMQMTHQLKAPLDAIRSNIALLLNGYCGPIGIEARETLDRADYRAQGLSKAILDLLKLARINAPIEKKDAELFEIDSVIRESIDELKSLADQREIAISQKLQSVSFYGVREHVLLFIENLLSNAIVYSYGKGSVSVACGTDPKTGGATVTVSDTGIGIAAERLPHVFEEHFRTREAIQHNSASTGIGMAIIKKIAQRYRIHLHIESEPGKYTTVTALFPALAGGANDVPDHEKQQQ